MATAATTMPEVFVRKSSGLVRVMSPRSAFVYNVLTMGLIFPWTYLWAPGALPGGQLVWGILLAMVLEIPIALAYVWLSTALPRSGGDYVFQSRVLGGGIGFTLVFSGFVIWILQWVALSGWLLATLGFAPLFLGLGASMGNASLVSLSEWFTTPMGIVITSIANALIAMLILTSGFKNYVRLQRVMWVAILLAFGTMLAVFILTPASEVAGVTFACGYVFIGTALAGALLPFRAKALYEASPGAAYKVAGIPLVTIVGGIGALVGVWFLWTFLTSPELGLTSDLAYFVVAGVLLFSLGWYLVTLFVRRSAGINVGYAFKEVPPE